MEKRPKKRVLVLAIAFVLVIGTIVPGMIVLGGHESFEEGEIVVLAYASSDEEVKELSEYGEIIDHYGRNVLIRTTERGEEELKAEHETRSLDHRNELIVKDHEFDTNEGMPEIQEELKIDDYEPGTEGMYLVDLIGPVNPEWRQKLEGKGVEILNYVPNYAYEVRMTPEQAEEVEDLFFVDWLGVYQPEFKLADDLEPGLVNLKMVDEVGREKLNQISSKAELLSLNDLSEEHARLTVEVKSEKDLVDLAHMNEVYYVSNQGENELHDEVATQIIGGGAWIWDPDDDPYEPYRAKSDHGSLVNQLGWTGNDEVVAVADSGINPDHDDFQDRVVGGHYWYGDSWEDGHGHGTHVAGSIAGDTYSGTEVTVDEFGDMEELGPYYAAQGPAYDSELFSVKIFDSDGWIGPSDYFDIIEVANENSDSYIHSNSWGLETDNEDELGKYLSRSEAYDEAVRDANRDSDENEPMIIVVAAGNDGDWAGYNSVGDPATAKNVISVGSTENFMPDFGVDNPDNVSDFSSRGWTDDNRTKPDVVAPGEEVLSTDYDDNEWYNRRSGTSMAAPAVSGAASVVVEWYEEQFGARPSPAMVRSLLINTAYDLDDENGNTTAIPNRDEGWGMVNLPALMDAPSNFTVEDQNNLLTTGEEDEYTINYEDPSEPLKISLTWTDKEAQAEETWTLKNNLNLEVESPSGDTYRGNAFEDGWTQPNIDTIDDFYVEDVEGPQGWDNVNNVQNVYIPSDDLAPGNYTVRVIGENVPADANNDGEANQDYALTMYNAVPEGEEPPAPPENLKVEHADLIEEWHWMYDDEHRAEPDSGVGVGSPGPWYGAMRTELPAGEITDIAYHDLEEARSVQGYIYEDDGTEPGEMLGQTYEITDLGSDEWRELPLKTSIEIDADHYWVALEIDDIGGDYYPFGVMEPYQEDAGWLSYDGEDWIPLEDEGLDYSWALEAMVKESDEDDNLLRWDTSLDDPENVSHYNIYRSEDEDGPWDDSNIIDEVEADGSDDYEYIDSGKGMVDDTFWWYVVRAVEWIEEENEEAVQEPVANFQMEITDYDEKVVKGEESLVDYQVTNIGYEEDAQTIEFKIDGETKETNEVNLDDGENYKGTFAWQSEECGPYTLEVISEDHRDFATALVVEDAHFEVRITNYDDEVEEGEDVTVEYRVKNTGEIEDTQDIKFTVSYRDETLYDEVEEDIQLSPGNTNDGVFVWSTEEGYAEDRYNIEVASEDDEDDRRLSVLKTNAFAVRVSLEEREIVEGEEALMNYTIRNTKDEEDTQDIKFTVEEQVLGEDEIIHEKVEEVGISAGEEYEGNFTWQTEEGDASDRSYTLEVASEDDEDDSRLTVLKADAFNVQVHLDDRDIFEDEEALMNYTIQNTKDEQDTQDIDFIVEDSEGEIVYDDVKEDLTLEEGESFESEFTWEAEDVGYYHLTVASEDDEETSRLTVTSEEATFKVEITRPEDGDEFKEGANVTVGYRVENIGLNDGSQEIVLRVEGEEVDTREVNLNASDDESYKFTWEGEDAGSYNLTIASEDDEDTVMITLIAPFEIDITSYDEAILEGEDLLIEYEVTNLGKIERTETIKFNEVGGQEIDLEENITLGATETYEGNFTWTGEDAGEYTFEVRSEHYRERVRRVSVYAEGQLEVEILDYETEMEKGEAVRIEYRVENTGDMFVRQEIEFLVNRVSENGEEDHESVVKAQTSEDDVVFTHYIRLGPGNETERRFTLDIEEEGDYELSVRGVELEKSVSMRENISISVVERDDGPIRELIDFDIPTIVGIIVVIVIIFAGVGYMIKRES